MKKGLITKINFADTIFFIFVATIFLILFNTLHLTGEVGLWGIFGLIFILAIFSSYRFFATRNKGETLYFYSVSLLSMIAMFALVYKGVGLCCGSDGEILKPSWLDAFYFSFVTWTTLGYGDLTPPDALKPFAMVEAFMGHLFMALLAGKILFLLQKLDKGENRKES